MRKIKSGYKVKNFDRFISELESKEEFVCPVKGTCVMRDSSAGTCGVFASDDCKSVTSCGQVSVSGDCSIVASNGACANYSDSSSTSLPSSSSVSEPSPVESACGVVATEGTCNWYTYDPSKGSSYTTCSQVRTLP